MAATLTLSDGVRRQVDYWATVYKRTWRGSVITSFLSPLFYVLAMGVLLGGFIDGDPDVLEGATSYFEFVVPGLIAALNARRPSLLPRGPIHRGAADDLPSDPGDEA